MYSRRITADEINALVTDDTINDGLRAADVNSLITDDTINDGLRSSDVNALVTSARVNALVTDDTINEGLRSGDVNALVTSARVNSLVDYESEEMSAAIAGAAGDLVDLFPGVTFQNGINQSTAELKWFDFEEIVVSWKGTHVTSGDQRRHMLSMPTSKILSSSSTSVTQYEFTAQDDDMILLNFRDGGAVFLVGEGNDDQLLNIWGRYKK